MYIFVKYHGNLMSDEVKSVKPTEKEAQKFSIVTIKTISGEKKIPIPEASMGILQSYNDEFNLSQELGKSIMATQRAQSKAENLANNLLLELLSISNNASMELGKMARDKEIVDEAKKLKEEEKKKKKEATKKGKTSEKPDKPPARKKKKETGKTEN